MGSVYTVSQVTSYIKNMFTQDFALNRISIKGEVSNCKYHTSGHIYFTLKDGGAQIAAVMFAGQRKGLDFTLAEGQEWSVCTVFSLVHVLSSQAQNLSGLVTPFGGVLGSPGFAGKFQLDRTHFQDSVIDSRIPQGRRILKVSQGKIRGDDQGFSGTASGVYDVEDLFDGKRRVTFDAQVVNDQKVITVQLVQEFLFVFAEPLKFVQDSGKVRDADPDTFVDQCVRDTTGQEGLSSPDAAIEQNSDIVGLHFLPVVDVLQTDVSDLLIPAVVLVEGLDQI